MIANYHTHTRWCNHAVGECEDYFEKAISLGFQEIAMTDHVPHKKGFSWMPIENLPAFDQKLNAEIERYKDRIQIFKGFECEYQKEEMDFYRHLQEDMGYTFLIQGQHSAGKDNEINSFGLRTKDEAKYYAEAVCEGVASGMFRLLAHPDVIMCSYPGTWDYNLETIFHQIFKTCQEYKMPVEINSSGFRENRGYPSREVFEIAKQYDLRFLLGADAHHPDQLSDEITKRGEEFAKELGIALETLYPR